MVRLAPRILIPAAIDSDIILGVKRPLLFARVLLHHFFGFLSWTFFLV